MVVFRFYDGWVFATVALGSGEESIESRGNGVVSVWERGGSDGVGGGGVVMFGEVSSLVADRCVFLLSMWCSLRGYSACAAAAAFDFFVFVLCYAIYVHGVWVLY